MEKIMSTQFAPIAKGGLSSGARTYLVKSDADKQALNQVGMDNAVVIGDKPEEDKLSFPADSRLCIIADEHSADGWEYTGKDLLAKGYRVSVIEVSTIAPDEMSKAKETEFILWYAHRHWREDFLAEELTYYIIDMCRLVCCVADDHVKDTYMQLLAKAFHHKGEWTKGMQVVRRELIRQRHQQSDSASAMGDYDFFVKDGCYYGFGKYRDEVRLSNFLLRPLFLIKDAIHPVRLYTIENNVGDASEIIELNMEDLASARNFRKKLLGLGNYSWTGNDAQLCQVVAWLQNNTDTAMEVKQLGWQQQGFFCFCNGILDHGVWHAVNEMGIVQLDSATFYLPAMSKIYANSPELYTNERKFRYETESIDDISAYFRKIISVFGDNAMVGLCYYVATLFRDIIARRLRFFPPLNIFGPKGSGKTEMAETLMSFFMVDNEPQNIETCTIPAMADAMASVSNALVHLDEYKNGIDVKKIELLKDSWGGVGRSRMNMDKDKKREQARVDCGLIITGQEMPTADPALFTRVIYLTYDRQRHTDEERQRFNDLLKDRRQGAMNVTTHILSQREQFKTNFPQAYEQAASEVEQSLKVMSDGNDRIEHNWLVPLAAYLSLKDEIDFPFSYEALFRFSVEGIKRQIKLISKVDELAKFWDIISSAQQKGKFLEEQDFLVKPKELLKTNKHSDGLAFDASHEILMIRKNSALSTYREYGRQLNETLLPPETIRHYLENSPEFFGSATAPERFKRFLSNGEPYRETKYDSQNVVVGSVLKYYQDRPLCFDYEQVCKRYGISLKTFSSDGPVMTPEAEDPLGLPKVNDAEAPF